MTWYIYVHCVMAAYDRKLREPIIDAQAQARYTIKTTTHGRPEVDVQENLQIE